jgi:hypothetical protein
MFGVKPSFEPRNPMRSARVVSTVIRMIFGGVGGRGTGAARAFAVQQIVKKRKLANRRIADVEMGAI